MAVRSFRAQALGVQKPRRGRCRHRTLCLVLRTTLRDAIKQCEPKDGITVSFHHHFRGGDFVTAMVTSVKVVAKNPRAMFFWAATIGLLLAISIASLFIGLIVIMPVLGHATWHVYRKTVGTIEGTST